MTTPAALPRALAPWRRRLSVAALLVIALLSFAVDRGIGAANAALASAPPQSTPEADNPPLTLVAHRGVHQTFPLTGLTNETCTATIIDPPTHDFIENTIPSMRAAFGYGATAIELETSIARQTANSSSFTTGRSTAARMAEGSRTSNRSPTSSASTSAMATPPTAGRRSLSAAKGSA